MSNNVINQVIRDNYAAYHGDSCQIIKGIPDNSIHYSVFSPPFASLYTYSNSEYDMGNCKNDNEFYKHFRFLVKDVLRVTMPGRLVSFHCMNLPTSKSRDGFIGLKDFRGELIRLFQDEGWIYHSEVCIWKDPVTAMQRTKAIGLLHKQIMKDSSISRQGIADYLVTMRKPGDNPEPINGCFNAYSGESEYEPKDEYTGDFERLNRYSINVWQRYASPVGTDIGQNYTLNKNAARNEDDERHLCPLQLDVIERAIELWTNPNDIVLSPFMGIGSEGYVALKNGRKFIGIELKEDYFREAVKNIDNSYTDLTPKKATKKSSIVEDKVRMKNTIELSRVLPSESKKEIPSSALKVKVFGTNDTIENHFAKIHESPYGSPVSYKDLATFKYQNMWKVAANKRLPLDGHKTALNFGLQFYILLWYKFVTEPSNVGFIANIKKQGLPRVFKEDPEMSKVDIFSMLDDRAKMLAMAHELNIIIRSK